MRAIRGYAKTLDGVCDQLGIENPVVVGNSMGGFVAAEMALSFSTRVAKLVLVSAAGLSTEYLQREPLLAFARVWAAATTRTGVRSDPVGTGRTAWLDLLLGSNLSLCEPPLRCANTTPCQL